MSSYEQKIQGQALEVTVVGCSKLKDTEWISRQDPYVCLEYASSKFRTTTCTDGGKNPVFQEKFVFSLIQGLRELNVVVWNSNTLTVDDFIGTGKVQLHKVLSQGYDDSAWPLQTKTGRYAGEVKLILHYANANATHGHRKSSSESYHGAPSAAAPPPPPPLPTPYVVAPSASSSPLLYYSSSAPSPSATYPSYPYHHHPSYPPPPPSATYPPPPSAYPPPPTSSPYPYPPPPTAYPPPPPHHGIYPPPPPPY